MDIQDLHRSSVRGKAHNPSVEPSRVRWNICDLRRPRLREKTKSTSGAPDRTPETHVRIIARQCRAQILLPLRGRLLQADNVRFFPTNNLGRQVRARPAPIDVISHQPKMRRVCRFRRPHRPAASCGHKKAKEIERCRFGHPSS